MRAVCASLVSLLIAPLAAADPQTPAPALGTVVVDGSAGEVASEPHLPKLMILPPTRRSGDEVLLSLVWERDLSLSGEFDVVAGQEGTPDLRELVRQGVEVLVRPGARTLPGDRVELAWEVFLVPKALPKEGTIALPARADAERTLVVSRGQVRRGAHRLVDQLLHALTGSAGAFESELALVARVGRWDQLQLIDPDGHDLRPYTRVHGTILSPQYGPGGYLYYAMSDGVSPFRLHYGPGASLVPVDAPGSILSFGFSPSFSHLAVGVMQNGQQRVYTKGPVPSAFVLALEGAESPRYLRSGSLLMLKDGRLARDQRLGAALGSMPSELTPCETREGAMVLYTVGFGATADVLFADSSGGGGARRVSRRTWGNEHAACSPDGRLVALHARRGPEGPGLYLVPVARPSRAKRIAATSVESLAWSPVVRPDLEAVHK